MATEKVKLSTACPECGGVNKNGETKIIGYQNADGSFVGRCAKCENSWQIEPSEYQRATETQRSQAAPMSEIVAVYKYADANGKLLFEKVRRANKKFTWRQPDERHGWVYNRKGVPHILYNLPAIVNAEFVCVAEGEKDAETLTRLGFPCTSGMDGAGPGKWNKKPEYTEALRSKHVAVFMDNDAIGKAYAEEICNALNGVAASVKRIDLGDWWPDMPEGGDVSDYVQLGTAEDAQRFLQIAIDNAPEWVPTEVTATQSEESPTPQKLETLSAVELMSRDLGEVVFLVDDFLHQGLAVLSADPKIGKSWFALDLCLSIASGTSFLGYNATHGGALYLALEDSWRRLKGRMSKVMRSKGIEPPSNFYLATAASPLDLGLSEQIDSHMAEHQNTKIIVIDVLERIRSGNAPRNKNAYQIDSAEIARIKMIADKYNICIFMVHHNRKMRDASDPFLSLSGSQGILSSVDEGFTLTKEKREDVRATLNIISREMGDEKLIVEFDKTSCQWVRISTFEEAEVARAKAEYEADPVVKTIKGILALAQGGVELTAHELLEQMTIYAGTIRSEREIGQAIKKWTPELFNNDKIRVQSRRVKNARKHAFTYFTSSPLSPLSPTS